MELISILKENLRVGNITLRNFINLNPDELELVRTWRNHPEVRKWMYNDQEISKEELISADKRINMINTGRALVDGQGGRRVVNKTIEGNITRVSLEIFHTQGLLKRRL